MPHFVLDARTATPHFPGIGRYVTNLAPTMTSLLAQEERLTILHDPAHRLTLGSSRSPASLAGTSGQIQGMPVAASPFSLAQQIEVPRLLREMGADLYHSAYFLMPYALRPGPVPTLLTVYDLIPLLFPHQSTLRARLLARGATRLALRTAQRVVAISDTTRRDFLAHFRLQPEKIQAIPLAADKAFCPQSRKTVVAAREHYGLPERYLLYLGSNKPHKNLERLVETWARLQPQSMPLVIAGAWDRRYPEARQRASALSLEEQVRWLGPVPETDLPALYSGALLFVFPSLYEGFGLPVLEAMACGTPVACSNSSSLPEVAGDAALLVNPMNTEELETAVRTALENESLRQEMSEKGLRRAQAFSWLQTAQRTLEAYRAEGSRTSYAHPPHL
jgi:glycosyltransferase involved in cell wall biosynthesis